MRRAQDQRRVSVQQVDHCQGNGRLAQPHLALQIGISVLADGAGGGDGSMFLCWEQSGFRLPGQRLVGLAQSFQDRQFCFSRLQIKKLDMIVIDPEYTGYESQIKELLLRILRKSGINATKKQIKFERIDRSSPARKMASKVFKGDADPDLILGTKQIFEVDN
jgi:hypothetical protein